MRSRHDLQGQRDVTELPLAQAAGEVLSDASKVGPGRLPEDLTATLGQLSEHDSGVSGESIPLHETLFDQPVHRPGETAGGHHHPLGKLAHPQGSAGGSGQAKENVIGGHRQAVFGPELGIEWFRHVVMGMQERLPGPELRFGEIRRHRGSVSVG